MSESAPTGSRLMFWQVQSLPSDLRGYRDTLHPQIDAVIEAMDLSRVAGIIALGEGDCLSASLAAGMAFRTLAAVTYEAMSAARYVDYESVVRNGASTRPLLVVSSVSGKTPTVIQAVERAAGLGLPVLACTQQPDSPLARLSPHRVVINLGKTEPSPGIRTYQGTLATLLLLAIGLAERREVEGKAGEADRETFYAQADSIEATMRLIGPRCARLAESLGGFESACVLGSGPSYGTARFAAAKLAEGAGIAAVGTEIESWWHGARFSFPSDMPVFVVAPAGASSRRAVQLAAAAHRLGRTVISVAPGENSSMHRQSHHFLPVAENVPEEFSALVYHLFSSLLSASVAALLGRAPLRRDDPAHFVVPTGHYSSLDPTGSSDP